jgi:hypothetical protein
MIGMFAVVVLQEVFHIFRITDFLDFVHCPVFQKLGNTTFRKLDLFPSSLMGEDTLLVGSLRKS